MDPQQREWLRRIADGARHELGFVLGTLEGVEDQEIRKRLWPTVKLLNEAKRELDRYT